MQSTNVISIKFSDLVNREITKVRRFNIMSDDDLVKLRDEVITHVLKGETPETYNTVKPKEMFFIMFHAEVRYVVKCKIVELLNCGGQIDNAEQMDRTETAKTLDHLTKTMIALKNIAHARNLYDNLTSN